MDHEAGGFVPRKGMRVIGSDGEHVGDIDVVENAYVIVQQGIFPQDYYIPLSTIASHDDDAIYLDITKDQALEQGLGNPMVAFSDTYPDEPPASISAEGDVRTGTTALDEDLATDEAREASPPPEMTVEATDDAIIAADEAARTATGTEDVSAGEPVIAADVSTDEAIIAADETSRGDDHRHQTIELHQEELEATTRPVERGPVRIRKDVVEERQTFEVPVVEEEVVVTRRRVDKDVPDPDAVFTEEHIELPLHGQQVEIETQAHIVEEIDINKKAHERIEQVTETIRHEEVRVEGDDIAVDATLAEDDDSANPTRNPGNSR